MTKSTRISLDQILKSIVISKKQGIHPSYKINLNFKKIWLYRTRRRDFFKR